MISVRMLKICGESILKPLELKFKSCIESGKFPMKWKNANVVQFIKKLQITKRKLSSDLVAAYL